MDPVSSRATWPSQVVWHQKHTHLPGWWFPKCIAGTHGARESSGPSWAYQPWVGTGPPGILMLTQVFLQLRGIFAEHRLTAQAILRAKASLVAARFAENGRKQEPGRLLSWGPGSSPQLQVKTVREPLVKVDPA